MHCMQHAYTMNSAHTIIAITLQYLYCCMYAVTNLQYSLRWRYQCRAIRKRLNKTLGKITREKLAVEGRMEEIAFFMYLHPSRNK